MANEFVEYFKKFMDFVYGLVMTSNDKDDVVFNYMFNNYSAPVAEQEALISKLTKKGVFQKISVIDLEPIAKLQMKTQGNEYSSVRCAGYKLKVEKRAFERFRTNSPLLKVEGDEHELSAPYLIEDGEALMLWGDEPVKLRKRGNKTQPYVHFLRDDDHGRV